MVNYLLCGSKRLLDPFAQLGAGRLAGEVFAGKAALEDGGAVDALVDVAAE